VQLETEGPEQAGDVVPKFSGLFLGVAVGNDVIGITLERTIRMLPGHPHIERVVGWPGGISPPGSHGTERDSLPSFRSSHPIQENTRTQAQWANIVGCLSTSPAHQTLNRRYVLNRLNFFRAHRIK